MGAGGVHQHEGAARIDDLAVEVQEAHRDELIVSPTEPSSWRRARARDDAPPRALELPPSRSRRGHRVFGGRTVPTSLTAATGTVVVVSVTTLHTVSRFTACYCLDCHQFTMLKAV